MENNEVTNFSNQALEQLFQLIKENSPLPKKNLHDFGNSLRTAVQKAGDEVESSLERMGPTERSNYAAWLDRRILDQDWFQYEYKIFPRDGRYLVIEGPEDGMRLLEDPNSDWRDFKHKYSVQAQALIDEKMRILENRIAEMAEEMEEFFSSPEISQY